MNKIIYDLEASSSGMIILSCKQQRRNEFYERFGFVRVGAVARYEEISTEANEGDSTEEEESESRKQSIKTPMKMLVKEKIPTKRRRQH